ncbi:hypothetical protein TNCV_189171 [Trichonephila clavipes]|nr:hypothetical protein TNCV_189171 [Trichonephila clavipes]
MQYQYNFGTLKALKEIQKAANLDLGEEAVKIEATRDYGCKKERNRQSSLAFRIARRKWVTPSGSSRLRPLVEGPTLFLEQDTLSNVQTSSGVLNEEYSSELKANATFEMPVSSLCFMSDLLCISNN